MKTAAAFACAGLAMFACAGAGASPETDVRAVRTVVAVARAEGEPVSLTGHIRALTEESAAFRIDGRLIARQAGVGQAVRPGDVIAELDPQPQQHALTAARAQNRAARAAYHEASNTLERQKKLLEQGWVTRALFEAAERTHVSAKAQLDSSEALLRSAEDMLGYTRLLASSSGSVIATGAEAGEVVRAGQMIVVIAHDGGADAVFDVPASLLREVPPDARIDVALTDDPSVRAVGRVREVAPQADPVTRSYRVKIGLEQWPREMRLGATVTGQARMRVAGGIELPGTALTVADGQPAVWVVNPDSLEVSLRPVELERQDSAQIVVSGGLEPGEIVVTAGVHALRPGQKVRLQGASK